MTATLLAMLTPPLAAQPEVPQYRSRVSVSPVARYVPGRWSILSVSASNRGEARQVKAVAWFDGRPQLQFGREFQVPAQSSRTTSFPVLMPELPPGSKTIGLNWTFLESSERGEVFESFRVTERDVIETQPLAVPIQLSQTAVIFDHDPRSLAALKSISERTEFLFTGSSLYLYSGRSAPEFANGYAPADRAILLSNQIFESASAISALRTWLRRGGMLWIPLNLIKPEMVAALLEDALPFEVADRTRGTHFTLEWENGSTNGTNQFSIELDREADFVQSFVNDVKITHRIDDWPAAFEFPVGRGQVVCTTLGIEGWLPSPGWTSNSDAIPIDDYVRTTATQELAKLLTVELNDPARRLVPAEVQQNYLQSQIGFAAPSRLFVGTVSGAYCILLIGMGVVLRRRDRSGLMMVGLPVLTAGVVGLFVLAGKSGKTSEPKPVQLQIVEVQAGQDEVVSDGTLLLYAPDSVTPAISATQGGSLIPAGGPQAGDSTGSIARLTWTESDQWHYENLKLSPGTMQFESQQSYLPENPISATGSFDADGFHGTVRGLASDARALLNLSDAIIAGSTHSSLAVTVDSDGTLKSGAVLPAGEYSAAALLTDEQARRQTVIRETLDSTKKEKRALERPTLLAWAPPLRSGLELAGLGRPSDQSAVNEISGSAFFAIDLNLKRPPSGTRLHIPPPFLPYRAIYGGKGRGVTSAFKNSTGRWFATSSASRATLRFQVPRELLPLIPEEVLLTVRISAPARPVTFLTGEPESLVLIGQENSPVGTFEYRMMTPQLDADGGFYCGIDIGDVEIEIAPEDVGTEDRNWKIEWLQIEFTGTVR